MTKRIATFVTLLVFSGWVGSANATLLGDEITISAFGSSGQTSIVGPGVEYTFLGVGGSLNVDFDGAGFFDVFFDVDSAINIGIDVPIDAIDLDWVGHPSGGIVSVIDLGGALHISSLAWTAHTISLVVPNQLIPQAGSNHRFQIVTDHDVPVPATLALLGLGLAGLGWSRRKKA